MCTSSSLRGGATALVLLLARCAHAREPDCTDGDTQCLAWAAQGECHNNPHFMSQKCRLSCNPECEHVRKRVHHTFMSEQREAKARAHEVPAREDWEREDLTRAYPDSAVVDVSQKELQELALSTDKPIFTWFYAPWCKQCKLARPGVEGAGKSLSGADAPVVFAKLDCVRDAPAKAYYGVYSYPSFKVLRGKRHRWVEVGRNRSTEVLAAYAMREAQGPFTMVSSEDELRSELYNQVPENSHPADVLGKGEALAIAHLSSSTGAAATAYANLAAGCSVRSSPFNYTATTDAALITAVGLDPVPADHVAIVKLFSEPDGAPEEERTVPRIISTPLLQPSGEPVPEEQLCTWALSTRLPLLIDFDENPWWGKRAGTLDFVKLHGLLFLSPPHKELAGVVRAAAARFPPGSVLIMQFMISDMVPDQKNAMFARYNIKSMLDTPKLVFLDNRIAKGENTDRQRPYKATITEQGVVDFIKKKVPGLPQILEPGEEPQADDKDEL